MTFVAPNKTRIAGLTCYTKGDLGQKDAACVILFHGYGANGQDLFPLCHEVQAPANTLWIFPEAELSVPLGGGQSGKAWFDLDLMQLQYAMHEGRLLEYFEQNTARIEKSRIKVQEFLKQLAWPTQNLVLGGFSQGSMLAADVALRMEDNIKALILYSSTLFNPTEWPIFAEKHTDLRVLQSHGRMDPVLPFDLGRGLFDVLKKAGLKGEFINFSGGHEIPREVLTATTRYL